MGNTMPRLLGKIDKLELPGLEGGRDKHTVEQALGRATSVRRRHSTALSRQTRMRRRKTEPPGTIETGSTTMSIAIHSLGRSQGSLMRAHGGQNSMKCAEAVSALEGCRSVVEQATEEGAPARRIMGIKVGKIITTVFAENTSTQHDLLKIKGFVDRFNAILECLKDHQTRLVGVAGGKEAPPVFFCNTGLYSIFSNTGTGP